jgi:hypothetical protein
MQRGDIAKIVISILLFLFLLFVAGQIYIYFGRMREAQATYAEVKVRRDEVQKEHDKLADELRYYLNPVNLEKELRARFNFRAPGEKTLILVPEGGKTSD